MISKILLSKVLPLTEVVDKVERTTVFANLKNGIYYEKEYENYKLVDGIEEAELMHRCKQWAVKKGYRISSDVRIGSYANGSIDVYGSATLYTKESNVLIYTKDTEADAVFEACNWILDHES